ncbi:MAG: hypothetical protein AAGI46_07760 [Planctomycetota bacterium]
MIRSPIENYRVAGLTTKLFWTKSPGLVAATVRSSGSRGVERPGTTHIPT